VLFDGTTNAWHAGITQLYCVFIENLAGVVVGGEMFFNQFKKLLANIGSDAAVVWWVKPNNLFITVSSGCSVCIEL
jgi:hypothetical protein